MHPEMPGNKYFSGFGQLWVIQSPTNSKYRHFQAFVVLVSSFNLLYFQAFVVLVSSFKLLYFQAFVVLVSCALAAADFVGHDHSDGQLSR